MKHKQQMQTQQSAWDVEAALLEDFVDAWKSDSAAIAATNNDSQCRQSTLPASNASVHIGSEAPPSCSLAVPAKPTFRSTSLRRKHEMTVLRRDEETLCAQLMQLQQDARTHSAASGTTTSSTTTAAAWRLAAQRNRIQLQRAQRTNAALRASALDHKRMAKTLQRILLRRTANISLAERSLLAPLLSTRTEFTLATDDCNAVRAQLVMDVNRMIAHTNDALSAMTRELPVDCSAYRKWHLRHDALNADDASFALEVVHCSEVPFRKAAFDAVAQTLRAQRSQDAQVSMSDVTFSESRAHNLASTATGVYRVRHASRRFTAKDRTLSVAVAYVDSLDNTSSSLPGGTLKDEEWVLVYERAFVDPLTGATQFATRIDAFSRITPIVARSGAKPPNWSRNSVETALIPAWDRVLTFAHQTIENKLMDYAAADVLGSSTLA